jgi:hypothetical protein
MEYVDVLRNRDTKCTREPEIAQNSPILSMHSGAPAQRTGGSYVSTLPPTSVQDDVSA